MGILWSLFGSKKEPVPLKAPDRIVPLLVSHWRGICGFLVPLVLIPITLSNKPADLCMYVWACMSLMWAIQPVPVQVVGIIPIFAFPMLGVTTSMDTCKCYFSEMGAVLVTGSMMWSLMSYSKLDKRFACWLMKLAGPSHKKLLLAVCVSSALLSMVTLRMLVVKMMIPLVEELLLQMQTVGQPAPYQTKNVAPNVTKKSASPVASVYYLAVGTSATIGSIGFINASMVTLTFLAQMEKFYPKMGEEFCYMRFAMFTVPVMIVMMIFTYGYLLMNLEDEKHKMDQYACTTIRKYLNDKHAAMGQFSCHQSVACAAMVLLIFLLMLRYPVGFDGWSSMIENGLLRYVRDSSLFALFVVNLHSFPGNTEFMKFTKFKKRSELPVKQTANMMTWRYSNENTPWSYLFMIGGSVALLEASQKSGLHVTFAKWAAKLGEVPWPGPLLMLVVMAVVLANLVNFVAACGILMPIIVHVSKELKVCPVIPPLALGLACSLSFAMPFRYTPIQKVWTLGHVPGKWLAVQGAAVAAICAVVLFMFLDLYANVIWDCKNAKQWGYRP